MTNPPLHDLDVSRETIAKLEAFAAMVAKWTKSINLVAPKSVPDIWNRHILDSIQVYEIAPKSWSNWVDLGSGGGLPGLVIAILDPASQPMTLIESDTRKCLFLNTVRRELSLNVTVINDRIENISIPRADVLSARALAPLHKLLGYADAHLDPSGVAFLSKGETYQAEMDLARQTWDFDCRLHDSKTNEQARILEISRIRTREHD